MQAIIEVDKLSKQFNVRHLDEPYLSLRDNVYQFFQNPLKRLNNLFHQNSNETFWALKDISFEVYAGESIGIIGKNGAGKSTLLKILSRITPPTSGKVTLRGRVASLLEVGTGFHLELTGRENVYFNGAILGMKRKEIQKKFDEIVDFAGVKQFIDMPLKHYSSGMQLRLAFAVAAFLDAEILVIDEVLAVGDAEFQKKCLGKMEDVTKKEGRTVLFVSHNMNAVSQLCSKTILLYKGSINYMGDTQRAIKRYLNEHIYNHTSMYWNRTSSKVVRPISIKIVNAQRQETFQFKNSKEVCIEIEYEKLSEDITYPNIHLINQENDYVLLSVIDEKKVPREKGCHRLIAKIDKYLLNQGIYYVGLAFTTLEMSRVDFFENYCVSFEIIDDVEKRNYPYYAPLPGILRKELEWERI